MVKVIIRRKVMTMQLNIISPAKLGDAYFVKLYKFNLHQEISSLFFPHDWN